MPWRSRHGDRVRPYLDRIRYVRKSNGGTATALNEGVRNCSGDYFCWLSSDDLYAPHKVARQLDFMLASRATVSYSFFQFIGPDGAVLGEPSHPRLPTRLHFRRSMQRVCHINGCTVMFPTRLFGEVGLFDESLRYTHDYDLWMRLVERYQFHYLKEPLVRYRVHGSMASKAHETAIPDEVEFVRRKYCRPLYRLLAQELLNGVFGR
jgi:glycosyltransferase involved in cell wall biosynthesis